MTDIYDRATELEELQRAHALARQQSRSASLGPGLLDCMDCGEEIPAERRQAVPNCRRCVECAGRDEEQSKLFKR
ncbi:MAG: TraR/DksA C4-type zinc finger protein [Burkholderiaceae bacterium]